MTWDDLQTGDLILVSGCSTFSKIIKEAAGVSYSHLAMFVNGRHLQLGDYYCAWEATGKGVGEIPLTYSINVKDRSFFDKIVNPGAGSVAVRRLTWPNDDVYQESLAKFRAHRSLVKGRPYEKNKRELFNAVFPNLGPLLLGATGQDLSSIFCWEAVAAAWQAMGILPADRNANSYPINEFMHDGLPLQMDVTLGPLTKI